MGNKKRVTEFSANRKMSYDGDCYLTRVPIEIVKTLQKYKDDTDNVHWEGVWNDGKKRYIVLSFEHEEMEEVEKEEHTDVEEEKNNDYAVLKEANYVDVHKKRTKKGSE